jgi:N-terminal domain of reverse transcriptase
MDMLDAAPLVGAVNGPEDDILEWDAINWRAVEDDVRRLRQRIFTASRAGDLAKVRNLQKLMLRSLSNTLVSVRREGSRVFRTGFWPFISRGDSQLLVLGVDFARRAVTHRRVEAFAIVPEFDVASDVLPGGLAGQVSHPRYALVLQGAEE